LSKGANLSPLPRSEVAGAWMQVEQATSAVAFGLFAVVALG
jgi:hypothetical protein